MRTFKGVFNIQPQLENGVRIFLEKLANTRRMKRNVDESIYGVEGEYYVNGSGFMGQDVDDNILDYNEPPSTQPSLWCQWIPTKCGTTIVWDGGEKFKMPEVWIEYIIENVLAPKGYTLNGVVEVFDYGRLWRINVSDNKVSIY